MKNSVSQKTGSKPVNGNVCRILERRLYVILMRRFIGSICESEFFNSYACYRQQSWNSVLDGRKVLAVRNMVVVALLFGLSTFIGCETERRYAAPNPPSGFDVWPTPAEYRGYEKRCATASRTAWQVAASGRLVEITHIRSSRSFIEESLPFRLVREKEMVGSPHVLRLGDGWYAGFDGGEFGGGLWWFSADGSIHNKLLDENIIGFAQGSGKAYAFSGLNHKGMDFGNVYKVHPDSHTVTHFATLGAEPYAFAVESNDSIIAVTSRNVLSVKPDGYVQELAKRNFVPFAPNSIAQSGDGDIYVGMNFFVLRFVRHGATYDEQWLVPAGCRGFRIQKDDCRCE